MSRLNEQIQTLLSATTFKLLTLHTAATSRVKVPVISTGRPFRFYREVFFDGRTEGEILGELSGKVVVDVGCGLTPFLSDSMFQACERAGIQFYGIDPKIGKDFVFGGFDRLKSRATGSRGRLDPQAPGTERALAALADQLPFENGQVDLILSSFLLTVWIHEEAALAKIFEEFNRVLKPGGSARIYPQPKWNPRQINHRRLAEALSKFDVRQEFRASRHLIYYPPAYTTILTKR
jgi:SAM-dependent methyltransferase